MLNVVEVLDEQVEEDVLNQYGGDGGRVGSIY